LFLQKQKLRYNKASHSVLQHWVWKLLKGKTKGFGPLHKVFTKIKVHSCTQAPYPWPQDVPRLNECLFFNDRDSHVVLETSSCEDAFLIFLHAFGKVMMRKKTLLSL
jgi:hypothetical protein